MSTGGSDRRAPRAARRERGGVPFSLRGCRVDAPLVLELQTDGSVEAERLLVLRLDAEHESARAGGLEVGEGADKQGASEAAAALVRGDGQRADVAAAAVQHAPGDPAHRPAVAAGEERR